jgi:hypothetical protein
MFGHYGRAFVKNPEDENVARERQKREREDELRRVPLLKIDKSKWPTTIRPIGLEENNGLGVDTSGRLYWDGKPVEIIGQRLDLTRAQWWVAVFVAVFTGLAAVGTCVQAAVAYQDWACKAGWPVPVACPALAK